MSAEMKVVKRTCVRVLWCGDCLELLELGFWEPSGYFKPFAYEVHVPGQSVLYKTRSLTAAKYYIDLLLGAIEPPGD